MSQEQPSSSPLFTQVDITSGTSMPQSGDSTEDIGGQMELLRGILAAQDRQNELLEELVGQLGATQRQRSMELAQWKRANPRLARQCASAAEGLSKVQAEFLESMTDEINENCETLMDGEFMFHEFVDRFGPRMAHLNGILQVLAQLGGPVSTTKE